MRLTLVDPYAPRVEEVWRGLEERVRPVYFLTWSWIENWLACVPRHAAPQLAVFEDHGRPVAACFIGRRRVLRHGLVASRALHLNTIGDEAYDDLCIEHNALLGDGTASLATLVALLPATWDELFLPAIDGDAFAELARAQLPRGLRARADHEVANYHVDLAKVRARGYPALLGSSTRAQVRKAQRQAGDVTLDIARDRRDAVEIYEELVALHQRTWRQRGLPGAFADPWIDRFHRRLIARHGETGELQLVRVRNADGTLGCLYNLVAAGRVLFYQCGFATPADHHIRPGYLCHAAIIEHSAAAGHAIYDLLGGGARYKKSLATDETRLVWARVQRPHLRFAFEDRARQVYRNWRASRAQA